MTMESPPSRLQKSLERVNPTNPDPCNYVDRTVRCRFVRRFTGRHYLLLTLLQHWCSTRSAKRRNAGCPDPRDTEWCCMLKEFVAKMNAEAGSLSQHWTATLSLYKVGQCTVTQSIASHWCLCRTLCLCHCSRAVALAFSPAAESLDKWQHRAIFSNDWGRTTINDQPMYIYIILYLCMHLSKLAASSASVSIEVRSLRLRSQFWDYGKRKNRLFHMDKWMINESVCFCLSKISSGSPFPPFVLDTGWIYCTLPHILAKYQGCSQFSTGGRWISAHVFSDKDITRLTVDTER